MKLPLKYNLRSVVQRKVRSMLTVAGIAVVIFLSILMIALSRGLLSSYRDAASPENVIALSRGAESMEFSAIDPLVFHRLRNSKYIQYQSGEPLASPEAYINTFVTFPESEVSGARRGAVRGVWPMAFEVHDQVRIIAGTAPQRGFDVIVGRLAATKLGVSHADLAIGKLVEFEGQRWRIAGIFEAPGTVLEAEIWCNLDDVLAASKRTDYSSIILKTRGASAKDDLLFDLAMRTDIRVDAQTERNYYVALANALKPVQSVSIAMTVILVLGGVMAGMNTMFTSILGRTREMGVLLVLGYKRKAVLISFVLESVLLCLAGGMLGTAAGALLNDLTMKIPMGAFRFAVDATTFAAGLGLAVIIGICGAVVPVMRVARLKTVEALRTE